MDRQQQTAYINNKIAELTEKAHLKNKPKWDFEEIALPAYTDPSRNEIQISKSFRRQWEKGDFDEKDADALLAHEIGHLMDYNHESRYERCKPVLIFRIYGLFLIIFLVVITPFLIIPPLVVFFQPIAALITATVSTAFTLAWVWFLPTILRLYVPHELKADSHAINSLLIDAQQFAESIVKTELIPNKNDTNRGFMVRFINSRLYLLEKLKHPSLNERLTNIGFEIKFPIDTKRIE